MELKEEPIFEDDCLKHLDDPTNWRGSIHTLICKLFSLHCKKILPGHIHGKETSVFLSYGSWPASLPAFAHSVSQSSFLVSSLVCLYLMFLSRAPGFLIKLDKSNPCVIISL